MDFFDLLKMVGGLALFLYGMNLLGDGLSPASGGRLERILEKLTSNQIKAVLMGAVGTGVIQSSSATTVMVVGFVNSGIMSLKQAVGIIMGANIGTTVTSWILSLTGIESDAFWIRMLKPTSFSPILALIGVVLIMFTKSQKKKDVGAIFVGFAILMYGMNAMSGAVEPLAEVPEFTNLLIKFQNPVFGVLAGLILTAVIQSSSASVGILQALCMTGAVSFGAAVPIIMGQNIGTCITALLSSIGTSRNARRTAMVHLYFNIIGTVLFLVLFYGINAFVHFPFLETSANAAGIAIVHSGIGASRNAKRAALIHLYFNIIGTILFLGIFYTANAIHPFAFLGEVATPFGIAVVHSCFNVAATLVLLPFSNGLVKLACLTLPTHEDVKEMSETDKTLSLLDSRFLDTPAYAVEQSRQVASVMADKSRKAMDLAMELLQGYDEAKAEQVAQMETDVDRFEDELGTYLVKLSSRQLSCKDSETLHTILHCIGDFERISDHARNVKEAAQEMYDKKLDFSDKAQEELKVFERAVHDILDITMNSFIKGDLNLARQVEPMEEVIDGLSLDVKQRHVRRLRKGKCTIELGFILSDVITNFERVSDHCSNIAVCLVQVNEDEFDTHAYLDELRQEDNLDFQGKVMACREKYQLPPTKQERVMEKNAKLLAE